MSEICSRLLEQLKISRMFSNNFSLLTASQVSQAIDSQHTIADSLGLPFSLWNTSGLETSHISSNIAIIPATHNTNEEQNISFRNRIDEAKSIRFSNSFATLATTDLQPAELCTAEYITRRKKIITDGPESLPEQAINWLRAIKLAKICDLNDSLAAKIKDWEAAEPIQDGTCKELVIAYQEIDELEEVLRIEKCHSTDLERWLGKWKSEVQPTEQTDIKQLRLEKDILLHQDKNISSDKYSSENSSSFELTPGSSENCGSFELTRCPPENRGSLEPTTGPFGLHSFSVK
ncbi:hypothetical protein K440DRAFT_642571 [Wilcoxina mikolae CBS 423.85]|nr:hypothetical protein K440DRAFT_642571 [Wilcoxina mikolae CBS 423.85]